MPESLRILIVADQASTQRGGEAILPYHYFRFLRQRGIESWLVIHERTRDELLELFPDDRHRIYFVPDTKWHLRMSKLGCKLPARISGFTTVLILSLITGFQQRKLIKELIPKHSIQLIHQPTPVSPRSPSPFYGFGIPVIIGPMNGAMNYPPAFRQKSSFQEMAVQFARFFSDLINQLLPGKREAAMLLVANQRTQAALPKSIKGVVIELVENGVDLSIWDIENSGSKGVNRGDDSAITRFIFIGRLVNWKAIDLLLLAFHKASQNIPMTLEIVGDGTERLALEQQAKALGLLSDQQYSQAGTVRFLGWKTQQECAACLHQADAFILPSLLECGGAVVLEAMAIGLPVIATQWGGPLDYLDDSCGILVEPVSHDKFVNGLAVAMETLAQDPELRQRMGKAGQTKVQEQFDWAKKIDKIIALYTQAIAEGGTGSQTEATTTASLSATTTV